MLRHKIVIKNSYSNYVNSSYMVKINRYGSQCKDYLRIEFCVFVYVMEITCDRISTKTIVKI